MVRHRQLLASAVAGLLLAVVAGPSLAQAASPGTVLDARENYDGTQRLHYEYGPITITPGQNSIEFAPTKLKPDVPGYITRFKPDLIYADGTGRVPRVDVVHLHHGVWIINGDPVFAAGEEKSIINAPRGFGFAYRPRDNWYINSMLHNLTPTPTKVFITYDIDFVPADAAGAAEIRPAKLKWLSLAGVNAYPVFDVHRGWGKGGRYTFPDDATGAERAKIRDGASWTPPTDVTLLQTNGHVHPGGLWTDMNVTRGAQTKQIFRSEAVYFEPAGAVSWDVAMAATPPSWRVGVKAGDTVSISATYDSARASWYEVMGIMPVLYADGTTADAKDAMSGQVETRGQITHGPLAENQNKGGKAADLPDPSRLQSGVLGGTIPIKNFIYGRGDLRLTGRAGRPPSVRPGGTLTFDNTLDNQRAIYHTITGCKLPCNRSTGVAYPLADGPVFDSGELGTGPAGATAASGKLQWKTPKNLKPGTYAYFCRVHPFMRGAFRVVHGKAVRRRT